MKSNHATSSLPRAGLFGLLLVGAIHPGVHAQPAPPDAPAEIPRAPLAPATPPPAAPVPLATAAPAPSAPPAAAPAATASPSPFLLGGYVEAYYQYNLNRPGNGITNARGFDNRHNSFTLSNVALDAQFDDGALLGRVALQVGSAAATYYLAEPSLPGSSAANASDGELWKYVQQAYAGYRFDLAALSSLAPTRADRGLSLTAGLFLSPIGPESLAVRDNWTWSRSNLFFGLPFYHAGVRAQAPLSKHLQLTLAVTNGWNDVVDNNDDKSAWAQLLYTTDALTGSLLAFSGVERADAAPEGRAFRHLLDAHLTWRASPRLSLLAHGNAGVEPNDLGTSRWLAAALAARFALCPTWFIAGRADAFWEYVPDGASPIFWPVPWVSSATATLEARPHERASFRLELRHDRAAHPLFFGDAVSGDGRDVPFVPTRDHQTTFTLGATTWF